MIQRSKNDLLLHNMIINSGFIEKLLSRLDKVSSRDLRKYLVGVTREYGFLDRIVNSIQEGVIVVDETGVIRYLNDAACSLFALDKESSLGQPISNKVRGFEWDELTSSDQIVSREMEVFYPQNRFLNFYIVPLAGNADDGGEDALESGYAIILRDITENRRSTEATIESERMNALTMLAAGVAHEIGNPLNSLHIHLQLMDRKARKLPAGQRAEFREMVKVCRDEIERLDFIVTQFLRAIRPSVLETRLSNINEVVEESLTFLAGEINDRDILVDTDLATSLPLIQIDRDQLKQAFYNIIRNSFQAMNKGGFLRIRSRLDEDHIVISFSDTGGGISQEDMQRLFQPYHTTKATGTGLGLLIVRRIVREHGGEIAVTSDEGRGVTVDIRLPVNDRRVRLLEEKSSSSS